MDNNKGDDKITLSFLLNVIDGIRETPGRILIITSNYYSKIDQAFKRPGRIDYSLEMKNASIKTICEMYQHYYDEPIPKTFVKTYLIDNKLSPAKIVNIRLASNTSDEFLENLRIEMKINYKRLKKSIIYILNMRNMRVCLEYLAWRSRRASQ